MVRPIRDLYRPAMFGISVKVDGEPLSDVQRALVLAGAAIQRAAVSAGSGNVTLNQRVVAENGVVYITAQALIPNQQCEYPEAGEVTGLSVLDPVSTSSFMNKG